MSLFGHKKHRRNRVKRHRRNPVRRFHRNPLGSFTSYLPMVLGGAAGAVALRFVPQKFGMVPGSIMDYGVKLATIVGGGYVADRFISAKAAEGWVIGSAAIFVTDILAPVLANVGLAGYEAFPTMNSPVLEGFGADPSYHDAYSY